MKKLFYILLAALFFISCNEKKKEMLPEQTFIVKHSMGVDTIKARDSYADKRAVTFYGDYLYGQKVGVFFAPYSFRAIRK